MKYQDASFPRRPNPPLRTILFILQWLFLSTAQVLIFAPSYLAYYFLALDSYLVLYSSSYAAATSPNVKRHAILQDYFKILGLRLLYSRAFATATSPSVKTRATPKTTLAISRTIGGGFATTVVVYTVAYVACLIF